MFVFVWFLTGPLFHYSNTWQLVINTTTTIMTFIMEQESRDFRQKRESSAY